MRMRAALATAATLGGLVVAPTSASGAAETCQGRPATIVAQPRGTTTGTAGDDVIVGKAASIEALGGNDVICVKSGFVAAGDGNDSIEVSGTSSSRSATVELGQGDDRFVGGPAPDFVLVDGRSPGSDTVSTGAGADIVSTFGAEPGQLVADLGPGEDLLNLELLAGASAQVQAGTGPDTLSFRGNALVHGFDLVTGAVTRDGVAAGSLSGFEEHDVFLARRSTLRMLGTAGPEDLVVSAGQVDLALGDGRDSVFLDGPAPTGGAVDLGPGRDSLEVGAGRRLRADLVRGRLQVAHAHRRGALGVSGVEKVRASAPRVAIRGGPEAEKLLAFGCHLRVRGGGGADRLAGRSSGGEGCASVVLGGGGRDRMSGGGGDDRLVGGPGSDEANGSFGVDTCRAERETACER